MKGIKIDEQLIADAESKYEECLTSLDDRAQLYADCFWSSVIIPFCNRHNLRFWSGNGVWFFEPPKSGCRTLDDPEQLKMNWAIATGNAKLTEDPRSMSGRAWVLTCGEVAFPEFIWNLLEINRLLSLNFMGGSLGFWINDFVPSTFPRQPQ